MTPRGVAVVSDGSDYHRESGSSLLTELLGGAALLCERSGLTATAVLVGAGGTAELIAELRRLAPGFAGIHLVLTDPVRGRVAQDALGATLPVVTDRQTTAVATVAAALAVLAGAELTPAAARAVIIGAARGPMVATLAVAAGIGEIDRWDVEDAQDFPLDALCRHADVVIDLLGCGARHRGAASVETPLRVVAGVDRSPSWPIFSVRALPGLLAAAAAAGRPPDLDTCLSCARTLAAHTGRTPLERSSCVHTGQHHLR